MRRLNLLDLLLVGAVVAVLAFVGSFDFARLGELGAKEKSPAAESEAP